MALLLKNDNGQTPLELLLSEQVQVPSAWEQPSEASKCKLEAVGDPFDPISNGVS